MAKLICASITICDRVLNEVDGIPSLIRLADVFYVNVKEDGSPQSVMVTVFATGRVEELDRDEHIVQLKLLLQNGEACPLGNPSEVLSFPAFPVLLGDSG
jgi:hypothetical protein